MAQVNLYAVLLSFVLFCSMALIMAHWGTKMMKGWSPKTMYNVAACLVVASIISGCMSLFAVWIALANTKPVDYTHQDVIVDILGVLVTILMGWNIISLVDIKKKADEVDCIAGDFQHVVTGIMRLNMRGFIIRDDKDALIDSCFSSLEEILNCDNRDFCKSAVKEVMYLLHNINQKIEAGSNVLIYPDMRQKYLYLLDHAYIQSEYKEEVRTMIQNAGESLVNSSNNQFAMGAYTEGN